jgi:hypothetical protein
VNLRVTKRCNKIIRIKLAKAEMSLLEKQHKENVGGKEIEHLLLALFSK